MTAADTENGLDLPHPRTTVVLFGQERAEQTLLAAYRSGRMPHAVLLSGPKGIGKATLAYRLTRFMLRHPNPQAPAVQQARTLGTDMEDSIARQVTAGSHPDLVTLEAQEGGAIPVDAVRRAVRFFGTTAGEGGWRIAVVDAAEDLNANAANALLKALEEPPKRALFLLVSHAAGRLPSTIRSRCVAVALQSLRPETLAAAAAALGRGFPERAEDRALVAALGEGSVARSLAIADAGLPVYRRLKAVLDRLPAFDRLAVHAVADEIAAGDASFALGTDLLRSWMRGSLRLTATGRGESAAFSRLPGRLARWAEVWEKVEDSLRLADTFNLDRRHAVLSIFRALAEAAETSPSKPA